MVIAMREICRRDKGTEVSAAPEPNLLTYNVCQMASSLRKMVRSTMASGKMERNTVVELASGEHQFSESWRANKKNARVQEH